jgi:hypothetical protein
LAGLNVAASGCGALRLWGASCKSALQVMLGQFDWKTGEMGVACAFLAAERDR